MPDRWRTVRVRLTLAATVVAALVVLLAGLWRRPHGRRLAARPAARSGRSSASPELRRRARAGPPSRRARGRGRRAAPRTSRSASTDVRWLATPGYEQLPAGSVLLTTSSSADDHRARGAGGRVAARAHRAQRRRRARRAAGRAPAARGRRGGLLPGSWPGGPCGRSRRSAPRWSRSAARRSIGGCPCPTRATRSRGWPTTMNAMLDRLAGRRPPASSGSSPMRRTSCAARWRRSAPSSRWPSAPPPPTTGRPSPTGCWPRRPASRPSSPTCCSWPPSTRAPRCPTRSPSTSPRRPAKRRDAARPDRADVVVEVDAPSAAVVQGSRMQLRRALANLLDNAGRHARTTVRVSVHERDGRVRVLVDDDGPGIPEADQERVFERFVRLDEHRTRAAPAARAWACRWSAGSRSATRAPRAWTPHRSGGARLVLDLPPRRPRTRRRAPGRPSEAEDLPVARARRADEVVDRRTGARGQLGHHRRGRGLTVLGRRRRACTPSSRRRLPRGTRGGPGARPRSPARRARTACDGVAAAGRRARSTGWRGCRWAASKAGIVVRFDDRPGAGRPPRRPGRCRRSPRRTPPGGRRAGTTTSTAGRTPGVPRPALADLAQQPFDELDAVGRPLAALQHESHQVHAGERRRAPTVDRAWCRSSRCRPRRRPR